MAIFRKISNGIELTDCELYEYLLTAKGYCCEKGWRWEDLDTEEIKTGREWLKYWQLNGSPCGACVAPSFLSDVEITADGSCIGAELSVGLFDYTGTPPILIQYQWFRDDVAIGPPTDSIYTTAEADYGTALNCVVTLTNDCGQVSFGSKYITGLGIVPTNDIPPALQVSGTNEGDIIVTDDGTWSGSAPITYSYQWLRDGVDVVGETTQSYLITSADHGTEISCRVTATNDCGSASQVSDSVLIP